MNYKFPLATSTWDECEFNALTSVISSKQFTMSNKVAEFEKCFAGYFGSKYAVMVNSGSSANLIMVAALRYTSNPRLNLKEGDEVIVPAVSWPTTYYPLTQYGLKLKFVDIDLNTLNYNLDELKTAITSKTRAIMVVNLLGNPNNFDEINSIISGNDIIVLEDNCESMGAKFNNKFTGTFGVMGTFSTFFSHHISTMEGGMIITDDEELYHIMLSLRAHGWTRNLPKFNKVSGEKSDNSFEESFKFVLPGYNVRPLEFSGAIGLEQLKKLPKLLEGRRKNAQYFSSVFAENSDFIIQTEIGESSWFGFSLVIKPGVNKSRELIVEKLDKLGIESRPIVAGNFAKNPVLNYFKHEIHGTLTNASHIDNYGLFIGNHHYDITDAIDNLLQI